jgi:hypothetical protein
VAQACDGEDDASLDALAARMDEFDEDPDPEALLADVETGLGNLEAMDLEDEELEEWRLASVDALEQFERRADDPEAGPAVANHAARTLGAFEGRLCE